MVDEISSQVYQIQSLFPWPFRQLFIPEVKKDKVQRKDNFLLGKLNSKDWSHHHITRAEDYKHLNPAYMYNFDKILLNCQKVISNQPINLCLGCCLSVFTTRDFSLDGIYFFLQRNLWPGDLRAGLVLQFINPLAL